MIEHICLFVLVSIWKVAVFDKVALLSNSIIIKYPLFNSLLVFIFWAFFRWIVVEFELIVIYQIDVWIISCILSNRVINWLLWLILNINMLIAVNQSWIKLIGHLWPKVLQIFHTFLFNRIIKSIFIRLKYFWWLLLNLAVSDILCLLDVRQNHNVIFFGYLIEIFTEVVIIAYIWICDWFGDCLRFTINRWNFTSVWVR